MTIEEEHERLIEEAHGWNPNRPKLRTTKKLSIYVASSWRNPWQPSVVSHLRDLGHEVYDFRNPSKEDSGFSWREVDPNWKNWDFASYLRGLAHPAAERGFKFDMDALRDCDACVLVQPCGTSAHLELGWAVGAGKKTAVLFPRDFTIAIESEHSGDSNRACSMCGDMEGCHMPGKLRRIEPELMPKMCDAILGNRQQLTAWVGDAR